MLDISIQVAATFRNLPADEALRRWAAAAYTEARNTDAQITIRIVDEAEMRTLNGRYRHVVKATNVLAFIFEDPPDVSTDILGDVIICAPVVAREARESGLEPAAHWAHMVVHGVLHLCGFDHEREAEARYMEDLEGKVMSGLGFANPYER
ncbi:MAG: rRNA maturation RNase YbeY [Gammaproteobacteria bacterium]|nr:rRNA maturation RNase YbeY [Gammaproteobacteria bacterium]MDH3378916.1 rRNA maturation RNase YbeY [Gammaproteobacteria bacterium]